jgi:hypothetical protein
MNDGSQIAPATIRAEVKALFGLRWDTAVEWAVICWLSAWLLTTSLPAAGAEGGRSEIGPRRVGPWGTCVDRGNIHLAS